MALQSTLFTFVQVGIYIAISPAVVGLLHWLKSRLQNRQGPDIFQPYRDLLKLFRRKPIVPETASWIYGTAPWIVFGCYVTLGLLTPFIFLPAEEVTEQASFLERIFSWPVADLIVLVYLLGFAHFALGLAGMDVGAPFGDLGSSREMYMHFLSEPTLIFSVFALALKTHTTSFPGVLRELQEIGPRLLVDPAIWLILAAVGLVALIEAGRMPFDNPDTHLELTMIGKAIQLEYAGPQLALLSWAEAMRLTFLITLFANLLFPWLLGAIDPGQSFLNLSIASYILGFILKTLAMVCVLSVFEAMRVKLRLGAVITPATLALIFSVIAVMLAVLGPPTS
jgi:formate hydrogenlyase subunit 4